VVELYATLVSGGVLQNPLLIDLNIYEGRVKRRIPHESYGDFTCQSEKKLVEKSQKLQDYLLAKERSQLLTQRQNGTWCMPITVSAKAHRGKR